VRFAVLKSAFIIVVARRTVSDKSTPVRSVSRMAARSKIALWSFAFAKLPLHIAASVRSAPDRSASDRSISVIFDAASMAPESFAPAKEHR
jgi:hypothetical protein